MTDSDAETMRGPEGSESLQFVTDAAACAALVDVFQRVRNIRADDVKKNFGPPGRGAAAPLLVILVSRRLACIFEMLVADGGAEPFDGGFDPAEFEIVTDRVLDANPEGWAGRHAVLVDDVVNVGSTLSDRHRDLEKLVGESGKVTVLVGIQNSDRVDEDLIRPLGILPAAENGPIERDNTQMNQLALDLATCLYRSLTPYFTDFPIFKLITAPAGSLDRLVASERWLTADVTAPIADENQRAYTFIPTAETEDRIRGKAVAATVAAAELLKVRVYTNKASDESSELRLVPICVPGAMTPLHLDDVLREVADALRETGDASGLKWRDWRPRAKHRLLQMYLSACVTAEFWPDLTEAGVEAGELGQSALEARRLDTYFGAVDGKKVAGAFDGAVALYRSTAASALQRERLKLSPVSSLWRHPEVRECASTLGKLIELRASDSPEAAAPPRPALDKVARLSEHGHWVQQILSVFGDADRASRDEQQAKSKNPSLKDRRPFTDGIRLEELARATGSDPASDDPWERAVTSLAIDIANDLGVAVPATVDGSEAGPVFRHYRIGEGAFMANRTRYHLRSDSTAHNIDILTHEAISPSPDGRLKASPPKSEQAEQWARDAAAHMREDLPGDWIDEIWVGEIVKIDQQSFTAEFVSTIRVGDVRRERFSLHLLPEQDRLRIERGALVEWPVFACTDADEGVTSGKMRLLETRTARRA